jgi:hypothetical protein
MNVQMKNRLPGFGVCVDDRSIPRAIDPLFLCHAPDNRQEVAEQNLVIFQIFVEGSDVLARDDQQMDRGFRVDVLKYQALFILVENFCRLLVRGYLAENTSEHLHDPPFISIEEQLLEGKGKHWKKPKPGQLQAGWRLKRLS